MTRRKLVAANWKMNGSRAANAAWLQEFKAARTNCDAVVCAPFVYLPQVVDALAGTPIEAGAQNLSDQAPGAFTGEVAGEMLVDIGCRWVITGHSERRALYGETDALVAAKSARALALGLRPIVCVGETLEERDAGRTLAVVTAQLEALLKVAVPAELLRGAIAYEPVWAIGTGKTATSQQAQDMHAVIRRHVAGKFGPVVAGGIPILYGGSVKPDNAKELLSCPDVDGGLIGGASLKASDFLEIVRAC